MAFLLLASVGFAPAGALAALAPQGAARGERRDTSPRGKRRRCRSPRARPTPTRCASIGSGHGAVRPHREIVVRGQDGWRDSGRTDRDAAAARRRGPAVLVDRGFLPSPDAVSVNLAGSAEPGTANRPGHRAPGAARPRASRWSMRAAPRGGGSISKRSSPAALPRAAGLHPAEPGQRAARVSPAAGAAADGRGAASELRDPVVFLRRCWRWRSRFWWWTDGDNEASQPCTRSDPYDVGLEPRPAARSSWWTARAPLEPRRRRLGLPQRAQQILPGQLLEVRVAPAAADQLGKERRETSRRPPGPRRCRRSRRSRCRCRRDPRRRPGARARCGRPPGRASRWAAGARACHSSTRRRGVGGVARPRLRAAASSAGVCVASQRLALRSTRTAARRAPSPRRRSSAAARGSNRARCADDRRARARPSARRSPAPRSTSSASLIVPGETCDRSTSMPSRFISRTTSWPNWVSPPCRALSSAASAQSSVTLWVSVM